MSSFPCDADTEDDIEREGVHLVSYQPTGPGPPSTGMPLSSSPMPPVSSGGDISEYEQYFAQIGGELSSEPSVDLPRVPTDVHNVPKGVNVSDDTGGNGRKTPSVVYIDPGKRQIEDGDDAGWYGQTNGDILLSEVGVGVIGSAARTSYAVSQGGYQTKYMHPAGGVNLGDQQQTTSSFTQTFLRGILTSIDSRDPVVANAWLETLLDAIDLLPVDVIRAEIVGIAVAKSQLNQPLFSRIAACKILGKLSTKLDQLAVRQEVLPPTLSLCQDADPEVRNCICRHLPFIARGVGLELTKSAVLPVLVELANDETPEVRLSALETVVHLLSLLDDEVCTGTIVPLVTRACERARYRGGTSPQQQQQPYFSAAAASSGDACCYTLPAVARHLGRLCHGLTPNLSADQRLWFVTFYRDLAGLGGAANTAVELLQFHPTAATASPSSTSCSSSSTSTTPSGLTVTSTANGISGTNLNKSDATSLYESGVADGDLPTASGGPMPDLVPRTAVLEHQQHNSGVSNSQMAPQTIQHPGVANSSPASIMETATQRAQLMEECRQACAYNLPAMALFVGADDFADQLYPTFCELSADPSPLVRRAVAAILFDLIKIIGSKFSMTKSEVVALFSDDSVDVVGAMVTNMVYIIDALARFGVLQFGSTSKYSEELSLAILHMEEAINSTRNWRLHADCLEKMSCLVNFISANLIQDKYIPLLFFRAQKSRPLPCRSAAVSTLLVILRFTVRKDDRRKILLRIKDELAGGRSCHVRMLYLRMCEIAILLFSRSYFKQHFYTDCLQLAQDRVPNIRLKVVTLLPHLKSLLNLPADQDHLLHLESTVKQLLHRETDRDVLAALQQAINSLAAIDETLAGAHPAATSGTAEDDRDDERKLREERLIASMEEQIKQQHQISRGHSSSAINQSESESEGTSGNESEGGGPLVSLATRRRQASSSPHRINLRQGMAAGGLSQQQQHQQRDYLLREASANDISFSGRGRRSGSLPPSSNVSRRLSREGSESRIARHSGSPDVGRRSLAQVASIGAATSAAAHYPAATDVNYSPVLGRRQAQTAATNSQRNDDNSWHNSPSSTTTASNMSDYDILQSPANSIKAVEESRNRMSGSPTDSMKAGSEPANSSSRMTSFISASMENLVDLSAQEFLIDAGIKLPAMSGPNSGGAATGSMSGAASMPNLSAIGGHQNSGSAGTPGGAFDHAVPIGRSLSIPERHSGQMTASSSDDDDQPSRRTDLVLHNEGVAEDELSKYLISNKEMELYEAEYHRAAKELLDPEAGRHSPSLGGAHAQRTVNGTVSRLPLVNKCDATDSTDGLSADSPNAGIKLLSARPRLEPRLKPLSFRSALIGSKPVCSGKYTAGGGELASANDRLIAQRRSLSPVMNVSKDALKSHLSDDDEKALSSSSHLQQPRAGGGDRNSPMSRSMTGSQKWNDGSVERLAEKWAAKRDSLLKETAGGGAKMAKGQPQSSLQQESQQQVSMLQQRKLAMEQKLESVKKSFAGSPATPHRRSYGGQEPELAASSPTPKRLSLNNLSGENYRAGSPAGFEKQIKGGRTSVTLSINDHEDDDLLDIEDDPSSHTYENVEAKRTSTSRKSSPELGSSDSDDSLPPYPHVGPADISNELRSESPSSDQPLPPPPSSMDPVMLHTSVPSYSVPNSQNPTGDTARLTSVGSSSRINPPPMVAASAVGNMVSTAASSIAAKSATLMSYRMVTAAPVQTSVAISRSVPVPQRNVAGDASPEPLSSRLAGLSIGPQTVGRQPVVLADIGANYENVSGPKSGNSTTSVDDTSDRSSLLDTINKGTECFSDNEDAAEESQAKPSKSIPKPQSEQPPSYDSDKKLPNRGEPASGRGQTFVNRLQPPKVGVSGLPGSKLVGPIGSRIGRGVGTMLKVVSTTISSAAPVNKPVVAKSAVGSSSSGLKSPTRTVIYIGKGNGSAGKSESADNLDRKSLSRIKTNVDDNKDEAAVEMRPPGQLERKKAGAEVKSLSADSAEAAASRQRQPIENAESPRMGSRLTVSSEGVAADNQRRQQQVGASHQPSKLSQIKLPSAGSLDGKRSSTALKSHTLLGSEAPGKQDLKSPSEPNSYGGRGDDHSAQQQRSLLLSPHHHQQAGLPRKSSGLRMWHGGSAASNISRRQQQRSVSRSPSPSSASQQTLSTAQTHATLPRVSTPASQLMRMRKLTPRSVGSGGKTAGSTDSLTTASQPHHQQQTQRRSYGGGQSLLGQTGGVRGKSALSAPNTPRHSRQDLSEAGAGRSPTASPTGRRAGAYFGGQQQYQESRRRSAHFPSSGSTESPAAHALRTTASERSLSAIAPRARPTQPVFMPHRFGAGSTTTQTFSTGPTSNKLSIVKKSANGSESNSLSHPQNSHMSAKQPASTKEYAAENAQSPAGRKSPPRSLHPPSRLAPPQTAGDGGPMGFRSPSSMSVAMSARRQPPPPSSAANESSAMTVATSNVRQAKRTVTTITTTGSSVSTGPGRQLPRPSFVSTGAEGGQGNGKQQQSLAATKTGTVDQSVPRSQLSRLQPPQSHRGFGFKPHK